MFYSTKCVIIVYDHDIICEPIRWLLNYNLCHVKVQIKVQHVQVKVQTAYSSKTFNMCKTILSITTKQMLLTGNSKLLYILRQCCAY